MPCKTQKQSGAVFRIFREAFGAWRSVSLAALLTPTPVYLFGFVAWMAGSSAWIPAVEFAFEATLRSLLVAWLVGIPLLVVMRQLRMRNVVLFMLAGIALAMLAQQFLPELDFVGQGFHHGDHDDSPFESERPMPIEPDRSAEDQADVDAPTYLVARIWAAAAGCLAGWLCYRAEGRKQP
jgi:hypothetical protein